MASDLLETKQLMGKRREDLLALLGEPDSVGSKRGDFLYRVERGHLLIRFGQDDLVEDAWISSD